MVEGFALRDNDTYKKIREFVWFQAESSVGIKTFYIIDSGIRENPFSPLMRLIRHIPDRIRKICPRDMISIFRVGIEKDSPVVTDR